MYLLEPRIIERLDGAVCFENYAKQVLVRGKEGPRHGDVLSVLIFF